MDHTVINATITVLKKGHPNGLFGFAGTVSPSSSVDEPPSGILQVNITVRRERGEIGSATVSYSLNQGSHKVCQHEQKLLKSGDNNACCGKKPSGNISFITSYQYSSSTIVTREKKDYAFCVTQWK